MKKITSLRSDLYFLLGGTFLLWALQSILRAILYWRNDELTTDIPVGEIVNSFLVGMRFDFIVIAYVMIPLVLFLLYPAGLNKKIGRIYLIIIALIITFLAIMELDFYHEFHVRLNSLVFQYIQEDPETVASMVWNGFPVVRYLLIIGFITGLFAWLLTKISRYLDDKTQGKSLYVIRCVAFLVVLVLTALAARGTLRHGPPLRWGDAFHSDYLFANHLALNGSFTLIKAVIAESHKGEEQKKWLSKMDMDSAEKIVQKLLLTERDTVINSEFSPVYRRYHSPVPLPKKPLNVVFILMESFNGAFVGSLGHDYGITPEFDKIRKQGVLFDHFFSNGTHTHQGMFASMACFPNLPGYETLMQLPQGDTKFAGILKVINDRNYKSYYIYNGDFAWDNQNGFFGGQGMQTFIGRHDFINPKFSDPTWGVSDEDMFDRAAQELKKIPKDQPFFAFLQTLSNHTPYALPDPLPVERVTEFGGLNEHLTAMRYADWALGQFFKKIQHDGFYKNTIFVLVGDHGFGTNKQVTDMDLMRFNVPLLVIAPDILKNHDATNSIVGSQVDIVPIMAGLLGGDSSISCWGRDLLNVSDAGFAMIKPSSSDHTTAFIQGDKLLVKSPNLPEKLYNYNLKDVDKTQVISDEVLQQSLSQKLLAYIQVSMDLLLHGKAGHE
ncbi:MAG: sulfatase-like hydrolase/transferase [Methylophaga sp.]|nr:sulfatase-like hydrolase/transferase [Methylophaga sp.]